MEIGSDIFLFETPSEWALWIEANQKTKNSIWIRFGKKNSGLKSITYEEALDVALCYGWIDSIKKAYDTVSWVQWFTIRKPRSVWSQINKDKALAFIEVGAMQPSGFAAIEAAKKNGNWDNAYQSQRNIEVWPDFQAELDANPEAKRFFQTLNSVNRYAILHRIQAAKTTQARENKIQQFVKMLLENKKIY